MVKNSRKNIRRMIAIFLILTLSFMPRATAQTVIGDSSSETVSVKDVSSSFDQPDLEHNPVILREDISKRGEYEKHFLNDDGGFTAVSYHEPVHYQKADGSWGEIDNTLLEVTNEDGPKRYKNKDGLFDVSFAEYPGKDMVSIATKDGCQITFGPVLNKQEITVISDLSSSASSDSSEQTTESEKIAEHSASGKSSDRFLPINENTTARMRAKDLSAIPPEEHKMVADKVYSEIVFEDALGSGTDIEYIVSANQVKENLILESAADIAPYSFQLIADGLTAVLNPDNTIEFSDPSGNIVFYMPAPFMFDSGDGYSEAIVVELTKADGFYILTYLPDCAWLESPDRVWPVTVDPTVKTKTGVSYIDDRTVKNTGGTCSLTEPYLYVGLRNGQTHYSYIQHHCGSNNGMPTIPARSLITASFARAYINSSTANNVPLTASMVNTSWNGSTLTYANRPTNLTTLVSGVKPTSGYYEFNVTEALGRWYSGNTNTTGNNKNYGIRLSTTSGSESVKLYSGNFSAASMRPVIHVNYLPEVTNIPVGKYFIRNKLILNGSERYLDVHNGVVANHQPLVSWIYKGLPCQRWKLSKFNDGSYRISSALTPPAGQQYAISVPGGTDANNVKLDMWLNANAQAFTFHQRVSGSYYIRPYCSRIRVLEVPNTTETDVNSRNVKLFTSNYGAGMQWVLEAVNFGRAPSYNSIETSDVGINCGGFALRMDGWVNLAYNSTIESAAAQTIDLFQHYQPNRSIRRIQGTNLVPTYSISSNEYRVALRVRENALRWDFHYMIQTNDGQWAHKSGRSPSELIGYINPSTYNWSNGYNSATIYFAVTW